MAIWFNVKEARDFLLSEEFVYTMRPKRRREGRDMLCWNSFGKRGMVLVKFVKEIENDNELEEFVKWTGFKNVKEWRKVAGESRFLYRVEILSVKI